MVTGCFCAAVATTEDARANAACVFFGFLFGVSLHENQGPGVAPALVLWAAWAREGE